MSDFFKFEEKDLDFPLYNGKPFLEPVKWAVLIAGIIIYSALVFGMLDFIPGYSSSYISDIIPSLLLLITISYCLKGELKSIFKKPQLKDLKPIIICFILYILFSAVMNMLLGSLGMGGKSAGSGSSISAVQAIISAIIIYFGLLGEELFKVGILLLFMTIIYNYTKDRKNSLIIATAITCILFGLLHLKAYGFNIIVCLLIAGLGCLIHIYPYLKTKNIVNSYLTHILIDTLAVIVPMLMAIH